MRWRGRRQSDNVEDLRGQDDHEPGGPDVEQEIESGPGHRVDPEE